VGYDKDGPTLKHSLGPQPDIEDIYSNVKRRRVEDAVATVLFGVLSAALDRILDCWRDQGRPTASHVRNRAGVG